MIVLYFLLKAQRSFNNGGSSQQPWWPPLQRGAGLEPAWLAIQQEAPDSESTDLPPGDPDQPTMERFSCTASSGRSSPASPRPRTPELHKQRAAVRFRSSRKHWRHPSEELPGETHLHTAPSSKLGPSRQAATTQRPLARPRSSSPARHTAGTFTPAALQANKRGCKHDQALYPSSSQELGVPTMDGVYLLDEGDADYLNKEEGDWTFGFEKTLLAEKSFMAHSNEEEEACKLCMASLLFSRFHVK